MKKLTGLPALLMLVTSFVALKKPKVVQINVSAILNARPITVLHNGRLVTWKQGIDGGGTGDGYLTMQAALATGDMQPHALPDNPVFAANSLHPEIALHYSNADSSSAQARCVSGEGEFSFATPVHKYGSLYLCFTSAEGPSQLTFELTYTDGTETQHFTLPDYYNDLAPDDSTITYLAHDLAKWDSSNKMRETNHHNIDAVIIHPNPKRILKGIKVGKNKPGYLVFWGAAGVVAG